MVPKNGMTIDLTTVSKIARLARIALTEAEKQEFSREISGILRWVEQLNEVDTSTVAGLSSVVTQTLPWREDVVVEGNQQDAILANAPAAAHGCFTVPKVVE